VAHETWWKPSLTRPRILTLEPERSELTNRTELGNDPQLPKRSSCLCF
jgi:hypothetical protein